MQLIDVFAVVTCDRPTLLRRCLDSYLPLLRAHPELELHVYDDSARTSSVRANRSLVEDLRRRRGLRVEYVGREERRALARSLADRSGVSPRWLALALPGGQGAWGNRQTTLLGTAGKRVLCVDDDTFAPSFRLPGAGHVRRFEAPGDPTELWFFDSVRAAIDAAPRHELDPFEEHANLLGAKVRRLTVRTTTAGLAGDSGMGTNTYFLRLKGGSRARLLATKSGYRRAMKRSGVWRGVCVPTLTRGAFLQAATFGFDNTVLLPPFPPSGRNQDGLFAKILTTVSSSALIGHAPYLTAHRPEPRAFDGRELSTVRFRDQDFWLHVLHDEVFREGTDADGLAYLGQRLIMLSTGPTERRARWLEARRQRALRSLVRKLETLLALHHQKPSYWRADVECYLATLERARRQSSRDVLGPRQRVLWQRVHDFGQVCLRWPLIWNAARSRPTSSCPSRARPCSCRNAKSVGHPRTAHPGGS